MINKHIPVLDIPAIHSITTNAGNVPAMENHQLFHQDFALIKNSPAIIGSHPIKTDYYNVALCLDGSCKKTLGHFVFEVYPASIHLVPPGHVHSHDQVSADLHVYEVLFKKEFLTDCFLKDNILDNLLELNADFTPIYGISAQGLPSVKAIYDKISEEMNQCGSFHLQIIKLLIIELLYEVNRVCDKCLLSSNRHISRQYQLVLKFKKLINEHYLHLRTVQEYAELLYVSAKYLTQIVKNETGENALHLIHKRQYLEAQYLLTSSSLSIKEVADKLNFDSNSHFTRFFKRYCGTNPSIFKFR